MIYGVSNMQEVTVQDCKRIVDTYLVKLFDVDKSDIVCVSAPTIVDVFILFENADIRKL